MAVTKTNETFPSGIEQVYTCDYVDTANAAGYLYPGFLPSEVVVTNITDGTVNRWHKGMAAGSYIKHDIAANGTTYTGTNGITVSQDPTTASGTGPFILMGTGIVLANKNLRVYARR